MLVKHSATRCNLGSGSPQLGSNHAHWNEINPMRTRIQSPDESAAHHAAMNRIQREMDKRLQRAKANGARVLKALAGTAKDRSI